MKINQFRIGNYLHDAKDRLCKVQCLELNEELYAPAISGGLTTLPNKPIPLTEEILFKSNIFKGNGYPHRFLNGFLKLRNGVFFFKYYGIEIELPFVHDLQNLHYVIKGKELEINL